MRKRDRVDEIQERWAVERPELDVSPLALVGRLHRLAQRLDDELLTVFRDYGLGAGEFDILATLRRAGGNMQLAAGELAAQTMVTSGAVTKRIDRLESVGLVERRANESDGRGRLIRLTPAGQDLIDEAFAAHMANEARLISGLSTTDRVELERLLRAWNAVLDDTPPGDGSIDRA